jgi:hypothetical protein
MTAQVVKDVSDYIVHQTDLSSIEKGKIIQGEVFQVESLISLETKKGEQYYKATLRNKLGSTSINFWRPHETISEKDFLELYLEGKEHHKWGKQWKVNHYVKSDYPGDDGFQKPLKFDPSMYSNLEALSFDDYSCANLYKMFLELNKDQALDEPNFINCPASKSYYNHRYGLLLYTKRMYELCLNSARLLSGLEEYRDGDMIGMGVPVGKDRKTYLNRDVLIISSLLHHCGSVTMFESLEFNSSKFTLNEVGFLSSPELETYKFLQNLHVRAMVEKLPVDPLVFKLIERTCRSVFTKDTISMEGLVLQSNHKIALEMEKFDKAKEKKPGTFYIGNNKVFVDVPEIINGKASKESDKESE